MTGTEPSSSARASEVRDGYDAWKALDAQERAAAPEPVMPVAQVRALVRLLYPDHMTPIAKRQIESACDEAEATDG